MSKKIEKRKKQRKDYEKKLRIKKNNWVKKINGVKLRPVILSAGDGILPNSKKITKKKIYAKDK